MHKPAYLRSRSSRFVKLVKEGNDDTYYGVLKPQPPSEARLSESNILKLRSACKDVTVQEIFQECLRMFAKHPQVYGSLGTVISREYNKFLTTTLREKERVEWLFADKEVGDASAGPAVGGASQNEVAEGLKAEMKELHHKLAVKSKKVEELEERVDQLRRWLATKSEKLREAEQSLEAARDHIDHMAMEKEKQNPKSLEPHTAACSGQQAHEIQSLQESVGHLQQTVSDQMDQKNILEDRLEFVQDLLRAKISSIASLEEEVGKLREENSRLMEEAAVDIGHLPDPFQRAVPAQCPSVSPVSPQSMVSGNMRSPQKKKKGKKKKPKKRK